MTQPFSEKTAVKTLVRIDVFISSPSDVWDERQIAIHVIDHFNSLKLISDRYVLRPLAYEDIVPAVVGQKPQTIVDDYMLRAGESDIFICILCHRMGTPVVYERTGERFQSGTEYEFISAYTAYLDHGKPSILLYRGNKPIPPDADQEQLSSVQSFFKRFEGPDAELYGLYKKYSTNKEFEEILSHDLDTLIAKTLFYSDTPADGQTVTHELIHRTMTQEDLREAPHVEQFYGRENELSNLKQWIVNDHCRLVSVLGIGGVGKTALAAAVTEHIKDDFSYVYWHSLQNAPSLQNFLQNCIQFISAQRQTVLPDDVNSQISLLIEQLQKHRCLVVLDNVESVLKEGSRAGQYREGYEEYGKLIQRVGEANHQSCFLLTSREKPKEIVRLEGKTSPVRTWQLSGIEQTEAQELLQDKDLSGSDQIWYNLVHLYGGNPLALKLVSGTIQDNFEGDIASFLKQGEVIFGDMQDLLDEQFNRVSEIERGILFWLAIEREAVSLNDLRDDITLLSTTLKASLLDALDSLQRRSLIETKGKAYFTLQPVIMEYVTSVFLEKVYAEIVNGVVEVLASHALIKAQAKKFIRDAQIRFILAPVAERLMNAFGKIGSEQKLKDLLLIIHQVGFDKVGYAAGNVLNLSIQLQSDLRGYDFSHLAIQQAYLQDIALPEINFAYATFAKSVFTGIFEGIITMAFNPSGELLATGTSTGEIWVWQVPAGIPVLTCYGHTDLINSVVFSPDGKLLASGSDDQTIRIWEVSSGNCLNTMYGHMNSVYSVAFSPTGNLLASGGDDNNIQLWNVGTGECVSILQGHSGWVRSVAFSPAGEILASGSNDASVRLWDMNTRNCIHVLQGHTTVVGAVTFSPNGDILASCSTDHAVLFWNSQTAQPLSILQDQDSRIGTITFSADGDAFASCSDAHSIQLWATGSGKRINTFQYEKHRIDSFACSPTGTIIASGGGDHTIVFWEINTGQCLKSLHGYSNWMKVVSFNSDGKLLASCSDDQRIRLWNVSTGLCIKTLEGHAGHIRNIVFSPDGHVLASCSDDQTILLWEVNSGRRLKTFRGHSDWVWALAFNTDGSLLASGGFDQTIRVWNVTTGQCIDVLRGHTAQIRSVAFSPDGSLIASASDDQTIRLWELGADQPLKILHGHTGWVWAIDFSPDGRMLASCSGDQTVRLWEVSTGQSLAILRGHSDRVWAVAFSPDGRILATGSGDRTIRLWEVSTGQVVSVLRGHTNWVRSVAFSTDGLILASCGHDGTIKLWDLQKTESLKTLRSDRPYERMNITGASGLTETQKASLIALGAIEDNVDTL